jgi:hypothetical protein
MASSAIRRRRIANSPCLNEVALDFAIEQLEFGIQSRWTSLDQATVRCERRVKLIEGSGNIGTHRRYMSRQADTVAARWHARTFIGASRATQNLCFHSSLGLGKAILLRYCS